MGGRGGMGAKVLRILGSGVEFQQGRTGIAWLFGLPHLPLTLLCSLHCLHLEGTEPDYAAETEELQVLLPRGLEVLGALVVSEQEAPEGARRAGEIALKLQDKLHPQVGKPGGIIAAVATPSTIDSVQYSWYEPGNGTSLQALEVEKFEDGAWKDTTLLRCQMQLSMPLYLSSSATASEYEEQATGAINNIIADLRSNKAVFLAEGPGGTVFLRASHKETASAKVQQSPLCSTLSLAQSISTPGGHQIPVPVKLTVVADSSLKKNTALLMQNLPARSPVAVQLLKLSVDVLCMASSHVSGANATTVLVAPALCDQLMAMCKMVKKNASQNPQISAFHFCPLSCPITAIYDLSYGETEIALVESRNRLHQRLGLPLDRPILRVANAVTMMNMEPAINLSTGSRRLRDVHIGLPPSGVAGGTQSLVEGSYEYYHYLQDRIDDNGWGCAYRSLQTIVSWFRLQQYTSVPVPTHREVQETLVEIGDKEASFVGSQEWIGAIEISFVLDKLLGVTCKVLNVRSGAELPSKCRELALHFTTQGTPIMIGGGVLAYTLLGIDYNEMTGESAFLILDPHYTGSEDLKLVRGGGWCGWKRAVGANGKEFFLANRFYNLLMPQRPNTV